MGLDLIVEGRAKPGHEDEWREFIAAAFDPFAEGEIDDKRRARFAEIVVPAYDCVDAPRVGSNPRADEWIAKQREAKTPEAIAACIEADRGYPVLALAQSPGVPVYSNGNFGYGVDATSFRGKFLELCVGEDVPELLISEAWVHKWPEQAVAYGERLLEAAEAVARRLAAKPAGPPQDDEIDPYDVLLSAGRWYKFWGERGHPIFAYF